MTWMRAAVAAAQPSSCKWDNSAISAWHTSKTWVNVSIAQDPFSRLGTKFQTSLDSARSLFVPSCALQQPCGVSRGSLGLPAPWPGPQQVGSPHPPSSPHTISHILLYWGEAQPQLRAQLCLPRQNGYEKQVWRIEALSTSLLGSISEFG